VDDMAVRKTKKGAALKKWFREDWRDVKTGKKCGRSGKDKNKRPYPACRPAKVAGRISKKEAAKKTGPSKVKWSVTASGRRRRRKTLGKS
jgi:hypothetical protein|tara:strand:+ start:309 stop:578 length:270 start_codon:yes stop_codon:yes gene_type:complete